MVLDTNVVSEMMSDTPHPRVLVWMDRWPARQLFVTAVTEAEVRTGIATLPEGSRRRDLDAAAERTFGSLFAGRVLPFDSSATRAYAEVAAFLRAAGRPISQADCQIAAISRSRGMAVATRNVREYSGIGVELVDPWAE